jgi:hypothetical protein
MGGTIQFVINGRAAFDQIEGALQNLNARFNSFFSGLQGRAKTVSDLNRELRNGSAAINDMAAKFSAVLGLAALRQFSRQAIEAGRSQAQLGAVLRSTGQDSMAFRHELEEQRKALMAAAGVDDDELVTVQRLLLSYGVRADQIRQLTALTLDYAAAMGGTAAAAAETLGRSLSGQAIVIRGMPVQIDQTLPRAEKLALLMEVLSKRVGGQARAAFQSMAPEVQRFNIRLNETEKALARLFLEHLASPFLKGLGDGLERLQQIMERFNRTHPEMAAGLRTLASSAGQLFGALSPALLALGSLIIVSQGVKIAVSALGAALSLARVALLALIGVDVVGWLGAVRSFADLRFVLGMVATAAAPVSAAITAITAALWTGVAAWKAWNAARLERTTAAAAAASDQDLRATIIRTLEYATEVGAMSAAAALAIEDQVNGLDRAKLSAEAYHSTLVNISRTLSQMLRQQEVKKTTDLEQKDFERQLDKLSREHGAARMSARAPGLNARVTLELAQLEDQFKLGKLALNQYLLERSQIIAGAQLAERAALNLMAKNLDAEIARYTEALAGARLASDKNEVLRLTEELNKLRVEKTKLESELEALDAKRKGKDLESDQLRRKERPGFSETLTSGWAQTERSWGNIGGNFATNVLGAVTAGVQAVSDGIYGWITGTQTWGQVALGFGRQVLKQFVDMGVQYAATIAMNIAKDLLWANAKKGIMLVLSALGITLQTTQAATTAGTAAATTAAWTPAAIMSSIASMGTASIIGLIAVVAALSAGIAWAAGAFAEGGRPEVGKLALVGERGPELFVPDVPGIIVPADETAALLRGGGRGSAAASHDGGTTVRNDNRFAIGVFHDKRMFEDWARSEGGRAVLVDVMRQHAHEVRKG